MKCYARLSCENPKDFVRGVKLSKTRFRQFLSQRYGTFIAEKFQNMFDFINNQVDYESFVKQLFQILFSSNKEVLYQLSFDFFDAANDDLISEFDLYKVMTFYSKNPKYRTLFETCIHNDIIRMGKIIQWKK